MPNFLLDTNAVITIFNNDNHIQAVLTESEVFNISVITIGELNAGAKKSQQRTFNLERLADFIARHSVLDCNMQTTDIYGNIVNELRLKGKPIPQNDMWIAATAIQYNLMLLTNDAHFDQINLLQRTRWKSLL